MCTFVDCIDLGGGTGDGGGNFCTESLFSATEIETTADDVT